MQLRKDPESRNHKLEPVPKPSSAFIGEGKKRKKEKTFRHQQQIYRHYGAHEKTKQNWKWTELSFCFFPDGKPVLVVVITAMKADVRAQDDDRNIIKREMFCRGNYTDHFHMMSKMKCVVRKARVPSLLCSLFFFSPSLLESSPPLCK